MDYAQTICYMLKHKYYSFNQNKQLYVVHEQTVLLIKAKTVQLIKAKMTANIQTKSTLGVISTG